jgi:hypothetical protein
MLVLTLPEPAQKSVNQLIQEQVRPLVEARDLTSATIRAAQIKAEHEAAAKPILASFQSRITVSLDTRRETAKETQFDHLVLARINLGQLFQCFIYGQQF